MSVLLTIGSPALAAYSLGLTVLNRRWLMRSFMPYDHPNSRRAVQVLNDLQQSSFQLTTSDSLLRLPDNTQWWIELITWLDYTHTWTISAMASTSWVILAYLFTMYYVFTSDVEDLVVRSQHVGNVWLWLFPIVTCWLQLSPKCDSHRTRHAIERANRLPFLTPPSRIGVPSLVTTDRGK
ncbi:hypothetical protein LshimejAT787_1300670 [Lyophyllum shimeji]|uniref:Uncharacterized protein n=1 Tax=Lyophyllum shimeji TaxID=47721 RepID=A0A9P3PXU4_LYOSH|nr:hypothetical protein LshimejAT787_1300570 [Lyophyllum shimeji]GLB43166.1 hypothetical protein LshimejAT787_1300670 [Lyophyllum shimeji]